MNLSSRLLLTTFTVSCLTWVNPAPAEEAPPKVPRFSVDYMDKSVSPGADFYHYASGNWLKNNPVPGDKSRWGAFNELQERNWFLLREILETTARNRGAGASPVARQVGDFYAAAMDTNRLEQLGFQPLQPAFAQIAALQSTADLMKLVAELHDHNVGSLFGAGVGADAKNSAMNAFHLAQGGLGLPDRDYYVSTNFTKQRTAYEGHVARMLTMAGTTEAQAKADAKVILSLETALAKACKTRTELRDPIANYHKFTVAELASKYPNLGLQTYLEAEGLNTMPDLIVGQPEFFTALNQLVKERPLSEWKTYLRWHVITTAAGFLHRAAEEENFAFYGTVLSGQPAQEPRWQRAAKVVDGTLGEALGQLFVEKYFTAAARARMTELIGNVKAVFLDRLQTVPWMTDATRAKALAKFARFTQKIGHPDKFRDYSSIEVRPDDYLGNVQRAARFESRRQLARVGKPVDKTEWHMTPPTVNAYFNPSQNEIVFPAGILQPPFFDVELDDAVNYGAIGVVIGHEITHGYDDEGRKYDAEGNLVEWWTKADAEAFESRAQKVVDQYSTYEALPGQFVNGHLTLGENLADLGGTSIAYEALERALAKDPSKRKNIDGFTPEQRFFLSLGQLWRTQWRTAELQKRLTTDPHSPGQFRAVGPHVNMAEFFDAFGIHEGDAMWRKPELRAKIW